MDLESMQISGEFAFCHGLCDSCWVVCPTRDVIASAARSFMRRLVKVASEVVSGPSDVFSTLEILNVHVTHVPTLIYLDEVWMSGDEDMVMEALVLFAVLGHRSPRIAPLPSQESSFEVVEVLMRSLRRRLIYIGESDEGV